MKTESELEKLRKKIKEVQKTKQSLTKDVDAELDSLTKELLLKEQQEAEEKKKNKASLEAKFNAFVNETQDKINEHLRLAEEELKKAVEISDQTGVPFDTELVVNFKSNSYVPTSSKKLKTQFSDEVVDDFLNDYGYYQLGWKSDGWSSSSLSC